MNARSRTSWVVVGVVFGIAVVLGVISLSLIGAGVGASGFIAGLLMAAIPVPFYIAFALWVDRFEGEPVWLLALAFAWGAAIAVFFSLIFNVLNEGILTAVAGAATGSTLASVLSAPFVEEITKGIALLLLFLWKRDEFDNVTDGIVYASMVGLGFAMTENVQYYGAAVGDGTAPGVFIVRGILGPFAHPLFTAMTGIGLGFARESHRRAVQWGAPVLGLCAAMFLHMVWNLSASFGLMFIAAYFVVMVPMFIAVIVIALFSLRREAKLIRDHLGALVAQGVLAPADVEVVTSVRRRIAASARALVHGGMRAWIARRRFHALATELAFHAWRCSRETTFDAHAIHAELAAEMNAVRAQLA